MIESGNQSSASSSGITMACRTQLRLALTVSLGYLTIGLIKNWTPTITQSLMFTSPHLIPSETENSWVDDGALLAASCGSLLAGPFLQKLGRKKTLLIAAPFFSLSFVITGAAINTSMLIVGRLLSGLCAGIVMPSVQLYVCECSQPDARGILGSLPALFMAIGVLMSYVMSTWLPWTHIVFVSALVPAALFLLLIPLPESPSWLFSQGFKEAADKSAKWLYYESKMNAEFHDLSSFNIKSNATDAEIEKKRNIPESENPRTKGDYCAEALLRRPVLIPLGLVVGVLVFQKFSGIDPVMMHYSNFMFEATDVYNYNLAQFIAGLVQVLGTAFSLFLINNHGRRSLLIFSAALMAISISDVVFFLYIIETENIIGKMFNKLTWFPFLSLMVFIFAFGLGFANVPFLLMGELLPVKQRSMLSAVASAFNSGSMFVIKTYYIQYLIGIEGVFCLYASICVVSCFFVFYFIPETKGKSLTDIEKYFEDRESN